MRAHTLLQVVRTQTQVKKSLLLLQRVRLQCNFLDTRALRNLSLASFHTVIAPLAAVQEDASEAVVGLDLYASAWPTQRYRL